jgi:hypothetical protein
MQLSQPGMAGRRARILPQITLIVNPVHPLLRPCSDSGRFNQRRRDLRAWHHLL